MTSGGQPVVGSGFGWQEANLTGLHWESFDPLLGEQLGRKKKDKKDKKGK